MEVLFVAHNITKEMVRTGYEEELIYLINNPYDSEIACQIGENWFYCDSTENRFMTVDAYQNKFSEDEIVSCIYDVLNSDVKSEFEDEYWYYYYYLKENGIGPQSYKIPVSWECYGYVTIEANNLEEAINKAWGDDIPLPEGNYIDGSWKVDEDIALEMN